MSLPNWITGARIGLVPVFLGLAYQDGSAWAVAALVTFGVASASDSLDGYLARRHDSVSKVGQFLDPLADKLLVGAALVVLVDTRAFPLWAALVIALREVAIQVLRIRVVSRGGTLPASPWAKAKTALQIGMICWWLLPWDGPWWAHWVWLAAALAATLWSALEYLLTQRATEAVR